MHTSKSSPMIKITNALHENSHWKRQFVIWVHHIFNADNATLSSQIKKKLRQTPKNPEAFFKKKRKKEKMALLCSILINALPFLKISFSIFLIINASLGRFHAAQLSVEKIFNGLSWERYQTHKKLSSMRCLRWKKKHPANKHPHLHHHSS